MKVSLQGIGTFLYRAEDAATGLAEHELDHVLVGWTDDDPTPDPDEADDFAWTNFEKLKLEASDPMYALWLTDALAVLPEVVPDDDGVADLRS